MTSEKFDAIVARLTVTAQRNPRLYQLKVALLALAGYAYLAFVLLLGLLLLAGLVAMAIAGKGLYLVIKGGWLLALFVWAILRSLWVRLPVPTGRRLARAEAPGLFAVLDDFGRQLGAPRFHEVVVNAEFNAAVVQVPLLGIFGWHRNYLLLGLPFMQAMPVEEFKTVIAHEYGHLASGHAAFTNWIYRQREMWQRVAAHMAAQGQGGWLIAPFLRRFVPYFNAYSFVLARGNEYEADKAAVQLVGAQATANALLRSEVLGRFLAERVYPGFYRQALHRPEPGAPLSHYLGQQLAAGPTHGDTSRWMVQAVARKTDSADTHPAYTDRVAAVRAMPDLSAARHPTAAEALLGGALLVELTREHDEEWDRLNRPAWKEKFEQSEKSRVRLAEIEQETGWTRLPWDQAWERAVLVEELRSETEALPLFQQLCEREPKHAGAAFAVGRLRLAGGDATGVGFLERAMQLDWRSVLAACDLLYGHHLEQGDEAAAQLVLRRYREQQDKLQLAQEERGGLERATVCEPHGLEPKALADLVEQVRAVKPVARAWLVRKRVRHFPDEPLFILGYKVPWYHVHLEGYYQQLNQRLAADLKLPGQYFVVSFDTGFAWLRKRATVVPGALILARR